MTMRFIGIFTENGLDQVCETTCQASQERKDLLGMGCTVWIYEAADELDLHAIDDWMRDGVSFAIARNRVENNQYL